MNVKNEISVLKVICLGLLLPLPVGAQSNPYFPLEQGLHHTYTSTMEGSPEKFVTVTGLEVLYGREVWALQWNDSASPDFLIEFYSIAPDGDVLFHGTRGRNAEGDIVEYLATPPFRIIDMPFTPGHTWSDPYVVEFYRNFTAEYTIPGYSYQGEIIGNDFPMTVPAGSFTALVVAGITLVNDGSLTVRTDYFFTPDTGMIRRDSRIDGQPGETTELLWSIPMTDHTCSWGNLKVLFR
jgi:hypothetical protein